MKVGAVKRILVIGLQAIGDVLLTIPAVRTLKMAFPRAHLTYITLAHLKDVLFNNPDIDEFLIYDSGILRRVASQIEYDLAINFVNSPTICLMSRARYRVGYKNIKIGHLYPDNVAVEASAFRDDVSMLDHYLAFTRALGLKDAARETNLFLTSEENKFAESFWQSSGITGAKRVVGLHPGGNFHRKQLQKKLWAARNYAHLADKFIADSGCSILIFHGPGEEKIAKSVCQAMQKEAILVPLLEIRKYAALVNKCNLFITTDGGPLHVAAALGVNLIGIFRKNSDAGRWFPYSDKKGCYHLVESSSRNISVMDVLNLGRTLIKS